LLYLSFRKSGINSVYFVVEASVNAVINFFRMFLTVREVSSSPHSLFKRQIRLSGCTKPKKSLAVAYINEC
jgi:hypothetical protein